MKKVKNNKVSKKTNRNKLVSLLVVIICFTVAFVILIKAQQNTFNSGAKEDNFAIKPEYGKTIVARDNRAIYPKYYVAYISDDEYSIYIYNYYETTDQYKMQFNELIDSIVDYNEKDKMIRCIHSRGYGTYQEVLNNLPYIVDNNNLLIY